MQRILITGMSGTGKSTLIAALAARGKRAIDLDEGGYSHLVDAEPGEITGVGGGNDWVWHEGRVDALLSTEDGGVLFVSGCSPNQSRFYDRFDHIVVLTAPDAVIAERLGSRTNNRFGKDAGELERTLQLKAMVEPALRRRADAVIDTSVPVEEVLGAVLGLVDGMPGGGKPRR